MNDFLGNIGKTVNKTTKKALKISGDMLELTKSSLNIRFEETKKDSLYSEIGKTIYKDYKANPDSVTEEISNFCKCIDEINASITAQKAQMAKIKKQKYCVACGQKLDMSVVYCFTCGEKQPEIPKEEDDDICDCCCDDDCCCDEENSDCCNDDNCCEGEDKCECGCDCEEEKEEKAENTECCNDNSCGCEKE